MEVSVSSAQGASVSEPSRHSGSYHQYTFKVKRQKNTETQIQILVPNDQKPVTEANIQRTVEVLVDAELPRRNSKKGEELVKKNQATSLKHIATGGFSRILHIQFPESTSIDFQAALKLPIHATGATASQSNDPIKQEISILKKLGRHEHIINIFSALTFKDNINVLCMEFCKESLEDFLKKRHRRLSGTEARQIMLHTAKGLAHLKASNIIHRDIKTENVMRSVDNNWKLSDFGLSLQGQQVYTLSGTIYILAPELFNTTEPIFSFQSDVFAYGVLLMHIAMNPSESRMFELSYGKISREVVGGVQRQMARPQFPFYEDFEKKWKKLKPDKTTISELIRDKLNHIDFDHISNLKEVLSDIHLLWNEESMICALAFVREEPDNRLDISQFIELLQSRIEQHHQDSETPDDHSKCRIG